MWNLLRDRLPDLADYMVHQLVRPEPAWTGQQVRVPG
jgi:hypothetical protein